MSERTLNQSISSFVERLSAQLNLSVRPPARHIGVLQQTYVTLCTRRTLELEELRVNHKCQPGHTLNAVDVSKLLRE